MNLTDEATRRLAAYLEARSLCPGRVSGANAGKTQGDLPEELFLLISRLVPMVNVDLLIKDGENHTLLTWRDDRIYGAGWHLPGGVIRFRETATDRVREVARTELGAEVIIEPGPIFVAEIIDSSRDTRGHAVSLLYRCTLVGPPREALEYRGGRPAALRPCERGGPASPLPPAPSRPPERGGPALPVPPAPGEWKWHAQCPPDLLPFHRVYERFL